DRQKGVCWVGSSRPFDGWELDSLSFIGITHISQTPFGWQSDPNLPDIKWEKHTDRMWWGESLEGVKTTTNLAREKGVESILKPHLWVRGEWPGAIKMLSEEDWKTWFGQYAEFILYYAVYAEEHKIPILCIGTELEMTSERERDWRNLITEIRKVYGGELTYAANFTEYEQVKFWDVLDYIGIQAYFPLADKINPDLQTLKNSWGKKIKEIEKVQKKFNKPVIFTEIGYCNTVDAAIEPWIWPNERNEVALSEEVQAMCYQAFFETVWKKDWLAGAYFWKWYPQPRDRDPDFTPQKKKAQEVMKRFYVAEF
uniref:glycoside hydrolase family 113 n=1 Tax=Aquiflexum sp. TaxID=1872584 RepID=UPI00359469EA